MASTQHTTQTTRCVTPPKAETAQRLPEEERLPVEATPASQVHQSIDEHHRLLSLLPWGAHLCHWCPPTCPLCRPPPHNPRGWLLEITHANSGLDFWRGRRSAHKRCVVGSCCSVTFSKVLEQVDDELLLPLVLRDEELLPQLRRQDELLLLALHDFLPLKGPSVRSLHHIANKETD